jgi:hypothetical protein
MIETKASEGNRIALNLQLPVTHPPQPVKHCRAVQPVFPLMIHLHPMNLHFFSRQTSIQRNLEIPQMRFSEALLFYLSTPLLCENANPSSI